MGSDKTGRRKGRDEGWTEKKVTAEGEKTLKTLSDLLDFYT